MYTMEDFESHNSITELHFEGLAPYDTLLKRSERSLRLENSSSSLWRHEEPKPKRPRKKPKTTGSASTSNETKAFFEQLERDTLLLSLSLLDIRSLIRCTSVDRRLNNIIRSPELRRLWSENQPPVVLLSSYTLPCKLLVPGSSSPAEVFPPLTGVSVAGGARENALVVASHRGLVCLRFMDHSACLDLAVGNPLTREWVALPRSLNFASIFNYKFRMEVGEAGVAHFKVVAFTTDSQSYFYQVFDSTIGNWSTAKLDFPPRTAFRWSAFDVRSGRWRTELIRNWSIKTGLERRPGEVHRLPHPGLHSFYEWEYNGSTYFASVWTVEQERLHAARDAAGEFAGYGVWKVQRGGEVLECVAAVWARELGVTDDAILANFGDVDQVSDCTASGNLVCFGGESEMIPTMPLVVYDLETGRWDMFDEQHEHPRGSINARIYYEACVSYSPSLLVAPFKLSSKLLYQLEQPCVQ